MNGTEEYTRGWCRVEVAMLLSTAGLEMFSDFQRASEKKKTFLQGRGWHGKQNVYMTYKKEEDRTLACIQFKIYRTININRLRGLETEKKWTQSLHSVQIYNAARREEEKIK